MPHEAMTKGHKKFLQSFMSRGLLKYDEAVELLKSCSEIYEDDTIKEHLGNFCNVVNDNIRPYGMEIKHANNEHDGLCHYAMVNTSESSITLLATQYSQNELEFFKKLIEGIVRSERGSMGSISSLDISDTLTRKMSKSEAQSLLNRLMDDHWIGKTERGQLYLDSRALMELDQYIFQMFEDVAVRCNVCTKLCLQGESCSKCDTRLHKHCASNLFKKRTMQKCPACTATWSVEENGECTAGPSTSSQASNRKRKANT